MSQFRIRNILERNPIIPVITIYDLNQCASIAENLLSQDIHCIEITLRTEAAFQAVELMKEKYGNELEVGVGTVVNEHQIKKAKSIGVDFMVSPGINPELNSYFQNANTAFICGVMTPSEIMQGLSLGYDTFKFFPAEMAGGAKMLKTFSAIFPKVKFCPTGGINETNFMEYLNLSNTISVGGSWLA